MFEMIWHSLRWYIKYPISKMSKGAMYIVSKILLVSVSKVLYCMKHKNLYWDSFFGYFVFVNDLSFTKCVTRKSFTAYLLASLLHSCFGRFGTIWMSALIYRCKKVRRRNLSDKACIETNRALSRTVITMKLYIVEHSNF